MSKIITLGRDPAHLDTREWDNYCMTRIGRTLPILLEGQPPKLERDELIALGFVRAAAELPYRYMEG